MFGVAKFPEDEDPFALVRRTDFRRAKNSPRRFVTKLFQVTDDCGESHRNVPVNVFEEAGSWSKSPNSVCNERPQVSGVIFSETLSGGTEWLARVSSREDVHLSRKLCPWEGFKIRPDRSDVQLSFFHLRNQVADGEGFDLTKSDCAQIWDCSFKSEINASVSGTKADVCNCFGSIHIFVLVRRLMNQDLAEVIVVGVEFSNNGLRLWAKCFGDALAWVVVRDIHILQPELVFVVITDALQ